MRWNEIPPLFPHDHPKWQSVGGLSRNACRILHGGTGGVSKLNATTCECGSADTNNLDQQALDLLARVVALRGEIIGRWLEKREGVNIARIWYWKEIT